MDKIPTKTWVGLLSNLLVMIAGSYILGEAYQWDSFITGFAVIMSLAFLASLTGVVMLVRGNPAGGIVGAVGSAFFVPIGLICLTGCLQSRDNIRFAGYAPGTTAPTPTAPVDQMSPSRRKPNPGSDRGNSKWRSGGSGSRASGVRACCNAARCL